MTLTFCPPQAIKYISSTVIGHLSSSVVRECIKKIKDLNLGLTEGEIVQIANLAPESDVELYLVSLPVHSQVFVIIAKTKLALCAKRCTDY